MEVKVRLREVEVDDGGDKMSIRIDDSMDLTFSVGDDEFTVGECCLPWLARLLRDAGVEVAEDD